MENKSLYELGVEYEKTAETVKLRIAQRRAALRSMKNRICSKEAYELKSELNQLYREYRDCRDASEYLKTYYDENRKRNGVFEI